MRHLKYFVGHKPPDFPMWKDFVFCNDHLAEKHFNDLLRDDRVLNEYAYLFGLKNLYKQCSRSADIITICQYRRFVVNKPMGRSSVSDPWQKLITPDEAQSLDIESLITPPRGAHNLVGSAVRFSGTMLAHYNAAHVLRDLLRFTADLTEAGLLTNNEAETFLMSEMLIPAASCGTYKLETFIELHDALETAALIWHRGGYLARNDRYQGRVTAFLLERLNSFFLTHRSHTEQNFLASGCTLVVSESEASSRGLMR